MKRTRWTWAVVATLVCGWAAAGPFLAYNGTAVTELARTGAIAAAVAPMSFLSVYTILGLKGAAKWWRDDIGTTLGLFAVAGIIQSGVLAFVFIFRGGLLNTAPLVWTYEGGLLGGSLIIFWRTWIWIRVARSADDED